MIASLAITGFMLACASHCYVRGRTRVGLGIFAAALLITPFGYYMDPVRYTALAQASVCAAITILIAFRFRRGLSSYRFTPSVCAFAMASLAGQQWISITARVLAGEWPIVSIFNTMFFGVVLFLLWRVKGNVAKMTTYNWRKTHA